MLCQRRKGPPLSDNEALRRGHSWHGGVAGLGLGGNHGVGSVSEVERMMWEVGGSCETSGAVRCDGSARHRGSRGTSTKKFSWINGRHSVHRAVILAHANRDKLEMSVDGLFKSRPSGVASS